MDLGDIVASDLADAAKLRPGRTSAIHATVHCWELRPAQWKRVMVLTEILPSAQHHNQARGNTVHFESILAHILASIYCVESQSELASTEKSVMLNRPFTSNRRFGSTLPAGRATSGAGSLG